MTPTDLDAIREKIQRFNELDRHINWNATGERLRDYSGMTLTLAEANLLLAVIERVGEQTEQNEGTYIECVECYRRPSGAWHLCHWHDGFDEANDRVRTILEGNGA